jgi:hypothetical protein
MQGINLIELGQNHIAFIALVLARVSYRPLKLNKRARCNLVTLLCRAPIKMIILRPFHLHRITILAFYSQNQVKKVFLNLKSQKIRR